MKRKGFTLIELVVVMAIIAVLALVIIGAIILARRTSLETVHRGNARTIQTAMESYYAKNRAYPTITSGASFESVKSTIEAALGANSVTLTSTATECSATEKPGGGQVLYDGVTGKYTIDPFDYDCAASLGVNSQVTFP